MTIDLERATRVRLDDGTRLAVRTTSDQWVSLASARNPAGEAAGWVAAADGPEHPTSVVLLGVATPHLLDAVDARHPHVPILAIETDPGLAALPDDRRRAWTASGRLTIWSGEAGDGERAAARAVRHRHPRPLVIVHPALARAWPDEMRAAGNALKRLLVDAVAPASPLDTPDHGDPPGGFWYRTGYCELAVQLVLRDLCRAGAVAFDVGANTGALTVHLSRLVGPRGVVCAFEASPRNLPGCQRTVVENGCGNVQVVHAAAYGESGLQLPFHLGAEPGLDSLYGMAGGRGIEVETLALDDFVSDTGLVPDVVKIDVEGAEPDVLAGMAHTLAAHRPHLVLEHWTGASAAFHALRQLGYQAFDAASYRRVTEIPAVAPLGGRGAVYNIVYVHPSRATSTPYRLPFERQLVTSLAGTAFAPRCGDLLETPPLRLGPGRYVVEIDWAGEGTSVPVRYGLFEGGRTPAASAGAPGVVAMYPHLPLRLDREGTVSVFVEWLGTRGSDRLEVHAVRIWRIDGIRAVRGSR